MLTYIITGLLFLLVGLVLFRGQTMDDDGREAVPTLAEIAGEMF